MYGIKEIKLNAKLVGTYLGSELLKVVPEFPMTRMKSTC